MTLLIIVYVLFLAIWACAFMSARRYGRIGRRLLAIEPVQAEPAEALPPLSVVVTAHNAAGNLRRHLPRLLEQDYERFEVIVVDMASTDDTLDVLERLERQHPNLSHTRTPASARDISLPRLALMLGLRAASSEWVVLTQACTVPTTSVWLTRIGQAVSSPQRFLQSPRLQQPDIVLGTARYWQQHSTGWSRRMSFHRMWLTMMHTLHVLSGHSAVSADASCMVIRRALLTEKGGFTIGQDLRMGAVELLAAQDATCSNVALMLTPSAIVEDEAIPQPRSWRNAMVERVELLRHAGHTSLYHAALTWQMLLPWAMLIATAIAAGMPFVLPSVLTPSEAETYSAHATIAAIVAAMLYAVYTISKHSALSLTARHLGYGQLPVAWLIWELALAFWHLGARLRHARTPRTSFRKSFITQPLS